MSLTCYESVFLTFVLNLFLHKRGEPMFSANEQVCIRFACRLETTENAALTCGKQSIPGHNRSDCSQ